MRKILISSLFAVSALAADPVQDSLNEAMEAYKAGRFSEAAGQLDYAAQLVREKKAEEIAKSLPDPLEGWTAEDATSQASGGGFMGSVTQAERTYSKDGGGSLEITILADSPMVAQMSMMFSNPSFIRQSGGEFIRIGGQPAMLKKDGSSIELNMVAGGALITLNGGSVDADEVKAYASKIDLERLTK
ncbi:MAG: hypothetical protein ACFCU4_08735 [Puniceicoccaceae bacterium]